MSERVLPASIVISVEREVVCDVFVDLVQCHHLRGTAVDRHRAEGYVTVRGLVGTVRGLTWAWHCYVWSLCNLPDCQ